MTTRTFLTTGALALIALTMTACGSDSSGDSAATTPAEVDLEVDAGPGIKFGSESYTVAAGPATIALVNKDSQLHSMVIVDADKKTLPGELEVGKSGAVDVGEYDLAAGTYQLLCLVPGHNAMRATLTVE